MKASHSSSIGGKDPKIGVAGPRSTSTISSCGSSVIDQTGLTLRLPSSETDSASETGSVAIDGALDSPSSSSTLTSDSLLNLLMVGNDLLGAGGASGPLENTCAGDALEPLGSTTGIPAVTLPLRRVLTPTSLTFVPAATVVANGEGNASSPLLDFGRPLDPGLGPVLAFGALGISLVSGCARARDDRVSFI